MKFYYSVDRKEEDLNARLEYEDKWAYNENELWQVVGDIADHDYSYHDGWEFWKNTHELWFYLWSENQEYLGRFLVQLEHTPVFYCRKVDEHE